MLQLLPEEREVKMLSLKICLTKKLLSHQSYAHFTITKASFI